MRSVRSSFAASALLAASLMMPGRAEAQAVAFQPNVGTIPDGVNMNVAPVVTADRRYVRLAINPNFSAINGLMNFPVAGGVAGGGIGAGLGGGGGPGGLGGAGGAGGGGGGAGGGFRNIMGGPGLADLGVPFSPEYLEASRKAAAQVKTDKAKPSKGKKALADPVVVPMKKGESKPRPPGFPRG